MKDKEWKDRISEARGEARGRKREHDQEWALTELVGQRPISPAVLPGGPSGWICWRSLRTPWRARPGGAPGPRSSRSPCLGTRYFTLKFDPPLLLPPVPQRQEPWVGNNIIKSLWGISYELWTEEKKFNWRYASNRWPQSFFCNCLTIAANIQMTTISSLWMVKWLVSH